MSSDDDSGGPTVFIQRNKHLMERVKRGREGGGREDSLLQCCIVNQCVIFFISRSPIFIFDDSDVIVIF